MTELKAWACIGVPVALKAHPHPGGVASRTTCLVHPGGQVSGYGSYHHTCTPAFGVRLGARGDGVGTLPMEHAPAACASHCMHSKESALPVGLLLAGSAGFKLRKVGPVVNFPAFPPSISHVCRQCACFVPSGQGVACVSWKKEKESKM